MSTSPGYPVPVARRGRATSSPLQFAQRPFMAAESAGSGAAHFSQAGFNASAIVTSSR